MHPIISLFRPMLDFKSRDESVSYLKQHPVLASPYYTELLENWAGTLADAQQQSARNAIALKLDLWERMKRQEIRVEVDNPILHLAASVAKGQLTPAHAMTRAAQPEFFVELMYPMMVDVCEFAEEVVLKDWRPTVTLMRIALAAIDARGSQIPENQEAMLATTVETWLAVVRMACCDVPDGRIFHDAVRRGEAAADFDLNSNPPGNILHRLGTLHLDPYVSGRSEQNFVTQLLAWQMRLDEEYGDELAGLAAEEIRLPPIEVALPKGVGYFRRAVALRSGIARGRTLKAMAQSMNWQDLNGLPIDRDELAAIAAEALSLLPAAQFGAEHAELGAILERLGMPSTEDVNARKSRAEQLFAIPVEEHVERIGEIRTIDLFLQNAGALAESDPMLALRLSLAVYELVQAQPEPRRAVYYHGTLVFIHRALVPDAPSADGSLVGAMIERIRHSAKEQDWHPRKLTYALLWLAASTSATDQEAEGLEALEASMESELEPDPLLRHLTSFVRAGIQTGNAVNLLGAGDPDGASEHYVEALKANLDCNQIAGALDIARRLLDLAKSGDGKSLNMLIAALAANGLALEREGGKAATVLIQSACRHAISRLMETRSANATALLLTLDVAKGRRFRAALEGGGASDWLHHPMMLDLQLEISALRKKADLESVASPPVLDENTLLTAYMKPDEARGGSTAAEQLRNLQIRFDSALDYQLTAATIDAPWIPTLEAIQSSIAADEILVIQYIGATESAALALTTEIQTVFTVYPIGATESAALALTTLLITREDCTGINGIFSFPFATLKLTHGEEVATVNPFSLAVADLRNRLCSPPGPRVADSRALQTLHDDMANFFGGNLWELVTKLRAAGKRHLRFCPHGPLHYYPFHLLGPEDQPLAQDWCVTYLPNLRLLTRESALPSGARIPLTSIGVNFDANNPHGLGILSESEPEAAAIGATYGSDARVLIGPAATESAAIDALLHSRRVHISTHGRHSVSAPSFQCIYFHPNDKDDGIIHAYELLDLDLRGLDLVTLSACETALGRFDDADNLRGIPAALLIAGVATIVGTLWPVEPNTATLFFTTFYKLLKASASKREAFVKAQKQTRASFPAYRDWGAFQLIDVSN